MLNVPAQAIEGTIQIAFPKTIQNNPYLVVLLVAMVHLVRAGPDTQTRPRADIAFSAVGVTIASLLLDVDDSMALNLGTYYVEIGLRLAPV